jgi:hypothetical protein
MQHSADWAESRPSLRQERRSALLPLSASHPDRGSVTSGFTVRSIEFGAIFAIVSVLLLLEQVIFGNSGGTGD